MASDRTDIGDRIKAFERQSPAAGLLMPGIPIVARLDGRCFGRFTGDLDRPFDRGLTEIMQATTERLMAESVADYGYTQSDEISLVWANDRPDSDMWFGGKIQKFVSILAATASTYFCSRIAELIPSKSGSLPVMDCRVFQVPDKNTAAEAILWREIDATRNSVQMLARSLFSHKECHGKSNRELQDMIHERGQNWNDLPPEWKRGSHFRRVYRMSRFSPEEIAKLPPQHAAVRDPGLEFMRSHIEMSDLPPMSRIKNLVGVMFLGESPMTGGEQ